MAMAPKRYSATRMDALLQCRFRVPTAYVENVLLPVDPTADLFLRVRLRREVACPALASPHPPQDNRTKLGQGEVEIPQPTLESLRSVNLKHKMRPQPHTIGNLS